MKSVTLVPGFYWPSEAPALNWVRGGKLSARDRTDWRDLPEDFLTPEDRRRAAFTREEVGDMLARQDRLGYERGFKVGIAHRNRERSDSLERARVTFGQLQDYQKAALHAFGLPNSVRAGVYHKPTSRRPEFTVDLGHNRR